MKTEVIAIVVVMLVAASLAAGYGVGNATHSTEALTSTATQTTTSTLTGPTRTSTSTIESILTTTAVQTSTITNTVTTTQTIQNYCIPPTTETAPTNEPLWTYPSNGTITSIAVSGDGQYVAVGVDYRGTNSGAVLLLDRCGDLLWQYQTEQIISHVAISEDGSHILANGFQLSPTPPGTLGKEGNSETYGFDSNGSLVWTRPSFDGAMSPDGSQVAVASSNNSVALFTWQGQTLWNDSFPVFGSPPIVIRNGSLFVSGTQGITMLGPSGNVLWTDNGTDIIGGFETRSVALTPTGYLVATSENYGPDSPGTVMLLSGNDTLLWELGDEGGAYSAGVLPDGSSIAFADTFSTASHALMTQLLFFSLNGTLSANLTIAGPASPSIFPTSKDTFLVGGEGSNAVWLFNSSGGQLWSYPLNYVDEVAVSGDANFPAASSNGMGGSTLYFLNISAAG